LGIFDLLWKSPHPQPLSQKERGDDPDLFSDAGYEKLKHDLKEAKRAVNVQPLSGSPANIAVYVGCLKPGDTILWMDLDAGGHLTHGHPLSASGIFWNIVSYGVEKNTELLDYTLMREQALKHKPKIILAGFSAYPRNIDWKQFADVANEVEKVHGYRPILMADIAHIAGLIAWLVMTWPFAWFDVVTTTTHKTLRGPRGWLIYMRKGKLQRNGAEINLVSSIKRGLFPGLQGGPHEHIIAAKAVAFGEILWNTLTPQPPLHPIESGLPLVATIPPSSSLGEGEKDYQTWFDMSFHEYAQKVLDNAQVLSQSFLDLWWHLVSGGTDNHLVLLDVTQKWWQDTGIGGKIAEKTLEKIGISVNKNMIPFDTRSPMDPSGLRLGTPALTTRWFSAEEIKEVVWLIDLALTHHDDNVFLAWLKAKVQNLCEKFPLWY